jgi:hypothetical protein
MAGMRNNPAAQFAAVILCQLFHASQFASMLELLM